MKRLLCLLSICSALLTALSLAARALGTQQVSPYIAYFSAADGTSCATPCLFGVQPTHLALRPIIKLLQAHPLTAQGDQGLFNNDLAVFGTDQFTVIVSQASDPVMFVTFIEPLPLGEVLAAFGAPKLSFFQRTRHGLSQTLLFAEGQLLAEVWHAPAATHSSLRAAVVRLGVATRGFNQRGASLWRGLSALKP
ncbi:MAG: hypothetical protein RML95_10015 [Anaerolineae bacterium]|nr:hypothetical protein [Anaerolineae bacterium]MDW8299660.1 hypothetical protein [Anaerolineae bacterium]